jgi:hypothetical protein
MTLLIPLVVAGGLLIGSQALAVNQFEQSSPQMKVALSGEQLHQWKLVQERVDAGNQAQAQQLSKEQISEMQRLLTMHGYDLGYDLGSMSGVLDENTKAAIRKFQLDKGLTVTSAPDDETLRALVSSSGQQEFFGLSPEFGSTDYTNENCCP